MHDLASVLAVIIVSAGCYWLGRWDGTHREP